MKSLVIILIETLSVIGQHTVVGKLMKTLRWYSGFDQETIVGTTYLLIGCCLLSACRSSIYSYKQNDGRIPPLYLSWNNEKAAGRKIYTGGSEMTIRAWTNDPIPEPYRLLLTYKDGYTNQRITLPVHYGKAQTRLDTMYRFVTKTHIPAYEDGHIQVSALVRVGRHGLTVGERYDLGMSLNWLLQAGNCSYSDGSGNTTDFGSSVWHYKPIQPETSSSGLYTGGREARKHVVSAQRDSLLRYVRELVRDTANHVHQRKKGTGLLQFKHNHWQVDYLIDATSPRKNAFEDFLRETVR